MTETERMRQLLDERGVEWTRGRYDRREFTRWYIRNNSGFIAASFRDVLADGNEKPYLRCEFYHITPEQAIEAALGRGTCHIEDHFGEWYCTGCGEMVGTSDPTSELCIDGNAIELWSYCPNCGRRVES